MEKEKQEVEKYVKRNLYVYDISIAEFDFSADAVVVYVSLETGYAFSNKLREQVETIITTIRDRVRKTGKIPLRFISITIDNPNGRTIAQLGIDLQDFEEYMSGKIGWEELESKMEKKIFE